MTTREKYFCRVYSLNHGGVDHGHVPLAVKLGGLALFEPGHGLVDKVRGELTGGGEGNFIVGLLAVKQT